MMRADAIARILRIACDHESFLITSHARPDGDAIGSALGLMHLLDSMGKRVTVAFADRIPTMYRCLAGIERIVSDLPIETPDVAILLECDSIERTGFDRIEARMIVNIDHHQSGRSFADFNWIDPSACAVGVMVYQLAVASGEEITAEMASCLYAAVLTDTGAFTFACTDSFTFGLAEHLLERGADSTGIAQAIYFSNPESKVRLPVPRSPTLKSTVRSHGPTSHSMRWNAPMQSLRTAKASSITSSGSSACALLSFCASSRPAIASGLTSAAKVQWMSPRSPSASAAVVTATPAAAPSRVPSLTQCLDSSASCTSPAVRRAPLC